MREWLRKYLTKKLFNQDQRSIMAEALYWYGEQNLMISCWGRHDEYQNKQDDATEAIIISGLIPQDE